MFYIPFKKNNIDMISNAIDNRISEMMEEINNVEFDYNAKKSLALKYGIKSNRINDIKKALYEIMDSFRKEHKDFTHQDWLVWNRRFDFPYSYKKIKEACEGETIEWIDFCIEASKKKAFPKDKRNEYFIKLKREIEKSTDVVLENMENKLSIITFPFKEKLYNRLVGFEINRFNYFSQFSEIPEEKKEDKFFRREWTTMKITSNNFDFDFFKKRFDEEFETMFSSNIRSIAERLIAKKISSDGLVLVNITEDPKFFEMNLKDNANNYIWCRSIIAAEFSNIIRTHYRFITTIKHIK